MITDKEGRVDNIQTGEKKRDVACDRVIAIYFVCYMAALDTLSMLYIFSVSRNYTHKCTLSILLQCGIFLIKSNDHIIDFTFKYTFTIKYNFNSLMF